MLVLGLGVTVTPGRATLRRVTQCYVCVSLCVCVTRAVPKQSFTAPAPCATYPSRGVLL